ncbi:MULTISPECIES: CinA family protein [Legionella]|uniref:Competence-damage inducible protein CinA n=1 Tax=Legionella drozanskii LLAP-1 TaxID=1212489 RepID=A0A0W0SRB6_9GAMM|nr:MULTISPECIES: CinA family protein [Legionella]KTC85793.1 Competence-damage inducible protein CinA [Legionella drozanskii LLAP-1]PJE16613.1 MAG: CinA family protein [Legionella sp.]
MDDLAKLVQKLSDQLRTRLLKIATAESCTGGLIAGLLTELPGSSLWFERGFVTYSNEAKHDMLGVKSDLIHTHGAVSQLVAEAMALGALNHSPAHFSLAVTGIAGPDGGSLEKPVGTVWFAWAMAKFPVRSLHCHFHNASRQEVRRLACKQALEGALSYLIEHN